jgi:hypothetical protein
MWLTTPSPLKGISLHDSGKLGFGGWTQKVRIDTIEKEMIEDMVETTRYASKVLDIQEWNVDQAMVGSKIFYSNQITQISNCFMSSSPRSCNEVQCCIFSFLAVDDGL